MILPEVWTSLINNLPPCRHPIECGFPRTTFGARQALRLSCVPHED